ncbi:hypothetical protein BH10PAT1_BH10PAT1_5870 [soil metagenome]
MSERDHCNPVTPGIIIANEVVHFKNMVDSELQVFTGMADKLNNDISNVKGAVSNPSFLKNIAMAATNLFARGAIKAPAPVQFNPSADQPNAIVQEMQVDSGKTAMENLLSGTNTEQVQEQVTNTDNLYNVPISSLDDEHAKAVNGFFPENLKNVRVAFGFKVDDQNILNLTTADTGENITALPNINPNFVSVLKALEGYGQIEALKANDGNENDFVMGLRITKEFKQANGILVKKDTLLSYDNQGNPHSLAPIDGIPDSQVVMNQISQETLDSLKLLYPNNVTNSRVGDWAMMQVTTSGEKVTTGEKLISIITNNKVLFTVKADGIKIGNNIREKPNATDAAILGKSDANTELELNTIDNRASIKLADGETFRNDTPFLVLVKADGETWYKVKNGWMRADAVGDVTVDLSVPTPDAPSFQLASFVKPVEAGPVDNVDNALTHDILNRVGVPKNLEGEFLTRFNLPEGNAEKISVNSRGEIVNAKGWVWRAGMTPENKNIESGFLKVVDTFTADDGVQIIFEFNPNDMANRNGTDINITDMKANLDNLQGVYKAMGQVFGQQPPAGTRIHLDYIGKYTIETDISNDQNYVQIAYGGPNQRVSYAFNLPETDNTHGNDVFVRIYTPGNGPDSPYTPDQWFSTATRLAIEMAISGDHASNPSKMIFDDLVPKIKAGIAKDPQLKDVFSTDLVAVTLK